MNNRFGGDRDGGRGGRGGFGGGRGGFGGGRGGFGGGRGGFGGGRGGFGGGRDGGRPTMHQATCDDCGSHCEVPFKPTGDRPVLCNDCFKGGRNDSAENFGGRRNDRGDRDRGGRDFEKKMHKATCDECGKKCELPFKPSIDKPVFCDDCFGKGDKGGKGGNNEQVMAKLASLEAKLDRIINLLAPAIVIDEDQYQPEQEEILPAKKKKTEAKAEVAEEVVEGFEDMAEEKPAKKSRKKKSE